MSNPLIRVAFLLLMLGSQAPVWADSGPVKVAETGLPDVASIDDVATKKQVFFDFMNPIIQGVNQRIIAERVWLLQMQGELSRGNDPEFWQSAYMEKLARYYEVDDTPGSDAYFDAMLNRVDIIPASLVLAQAANESGWGTSRFAREGNNLFGQWCFLEGCGLVPRGRPEGESYEVKVFDDVSESVAGYFQNVNTHPAYQDFRNIRSELRYLGEPASPLMLVWGLERYSTRGDEYIRDLVDLIKHNDLVEYDRRPFYASN